MDSLLPVLSAHLLVDLALTTGSMRAQMTGMARVSVYGRHGAAVFALMWLALSWQMGPSGVAVGCAVAIALAHLAVDLGKHLALRERSRVQRWLTWLFLDCHELIAELLILLAAQALHLVALDQVAGLFFPPRYDLTTILWYVQAHLLGSGAILPGDRAPYLLVLYLLGTLGGARVIQFVERAFYPGEIQEVTLKNIWEMTRDPLTSEEGVGLNYRHVRTEEHTSNPPGKPGASYWVGILERLAIMLWPLVPGLGLTVTVALGAKSIARYNQFKHRAFVEYFIIGTLSSVVWGSLFAWLVFRALAR